MFDIHIALPLIEKAVEPYPKAALFELARAGYTSPFEILVACILSIRTLDEVMVPPQDRAAVDPTVAPAKSAAATRRRRITERSYARPRIDSITSGVGSRTPPVPRARPRLQPGPGPARTR